MLGNFKVLLLFAFTGSDFRYGFIDRKRKGEGKACFFGNALGELISPSVAAIEFIHACDVQIKFINAGFFHHGRFFLNDFCNVV
ncbi:hypothetical protein D3C87_1220810 [compost metagenome]